MSTPREEANRLLNAAHQSAKTILEGGERAFDPFGLVLELSDGISIVHAVLDTDQPTTVEEKVDYIRHCLRTMAERNDIKGAALVGRMQLRLRGNDRDTDAFVVQIEHRRDGAIDFYVPFEWQGDDLVLSSPIAQRREPLVFVEEIQPEEQEDSAASRTRQGRWSFWRR